ncbi:hypothetical protein [Apis mellifera associated microvirus 17]|nr:hypothetical protein [Apis mellifera associated microvirus 17]
MAKPLLAQRVIMRDDLTLRSLRDFHTVLLRTLGLHKAGALTSEGWPFKRKITRRSSLQIARPYVLIGAQCVRATRALMSLNPAADRPVVPLPT